MALLRAAAMARGGGVAAPAQLPADVFGGSSLAAALAAVSGTDGGVCAPQPVLGPGPTPSVTKSSRTQINHVSENPKPGSAPANRSAALLAYQRRNVDDPCAPVGGACASRSRFTHDLGEDYLVRRALFQ